ncbi:methyl-accepting chemotaxis protein [Rummeliibacillus suwonensis]|uniref:methyl-accepting chemotaxis protein n=1 Tax=Rummeliibacillus suwonensis TaxID=1306154 RepID=UPI00289BCBE8|nr:methyl-accepting chemotaxis protein [Rummeliibacillus suwonensis]
MNISKKLNLSFYGIIILFIISIILNFVNLRSIDANVDEALDNRVTQIMVVDEIRTDLAMQGLYARASIIDPNEENRQNLEEYAKNLDSSIAQLQKLIRSETMQGYWKTINTANISFNNEMATLNTALDQKDNKKAAEIVNGPLKEANVAILNSSEKMIDYQHKQLDNTKNSIQHSISSSNVTSLISLLISIAIGVFLILFIRRTIIRPLNLLHDTANIIADGDLTVADISIKTKDEIGALGASFNKMKNSLRNLIAKVSENIEHSTSAAEELSASTEEVAKASQDVAEKLELVSNAATSSSEVGKDTSIAVEETAKSVQSIAHSTQEVHQEATEAQTTAEHGGQTLSSTHEQLKRIQESSYDTRTRVRQLAEQSEKIGDITKVITDITDQTNLLALNAAIEAARAGEHGKGFAVVAEEVRKLAEQSRASADEIVELTNNIQNDTEDVEKSINTTVVDVESGVTLIEEAQQAFTHILDSVDSITDRIEQVSSAAQEVSAATEEVSASVQEMANGANSAAGAIESVAAATEEQVATIQEINSVTKEMTDQAVKLQNQIQEFKV